MITISICCTKEFFACLNAFSIKTISTNGAILISESVRCQWSISTKGDKAGYNISGGIRKSLFSGLGTISFTINDLFHTLNSAYQTIGINKVAAFSGRETDTRRMGIAFTYRFGKAANARKRNNIGGAEDEKGRVN